MLLTHEGFNTSRLATNPREAAFAAAWKNLNKGVDHLTTPGILVSIVPNATPSDAKVAATVIQWLGSNIGMEFLRTVADSNKDIRSRLK